MTNNSKLPEPWLRGTLMHVDPVQRAVMHALELAKEDLEKWCGDLSDEELNARPGDVAPVAFHLRHIARSTDRLLTYAEGHQLNEDQLKALKAEDRGEETLPALLTEVEDSFRKAAGRIRALASSDLEAHRGIGCKWNLQSIESVLIAHHPQADRTMAQIGIPRLRDGVEVDVDHIVEHTHCNVHGAFQSLFIQSICGHMIR